MNNNLLTQIARNVIEAFLLTLGMVPSKGESLEVRDFGAHRVYVQQARVPDALAEDIDAGDVFDQLVVYLEHHNALPTAARFYPYNVEAYVCPCGCGTYIYISIYHDA